MHKPINLAILFIFLSSVISAQTTKINGYVTDGETGEPLPFINVTFKNTYHGTLTDAQGYFFIESRNATDTLMISCIGYIPEYIPVKKGIYQSVNVQLMQNNINLEEVVIKPGVNPAIALLKKITKNKEQNSPKKHINYKCEVYNKIEVDINNVDEKLKDRKYFKDLLFVLDNIDTSTVSGKTYLPVMITESISDLYYSAEPKKETEVIKASKVSGIKNASVSQFTGRLYMEIDVYDNFIDLFEPGFVSPISDFGLLYYKYFIVDSFWVDDTWCYQVSYQPKRKMERTLSGYFLVADTSYAIKKIQMRISKDANINFINDMVVTLQYDKIQDSIWFLTYEEEMVDFNLTDKLTGLFGRKTTSYKDIKINPDDVNGKTMHRLPQVTDDALLKDEEYWNEHRHIALSQKEENIYEMVDSVKQLRLYKVVEDIINLFAGYYYVVGPVELGPYYTFFSFNEIEGNRVKFGGRTSNAVSIRWMLEGYVAYGFRDEQFKYGIGGLYLFSKNPRVSFGMNYESDIKQLGQSENMFLEDNILSSLLRRNPNYKLTMVNEFKTYFEKGWLSGLSITSNYRYFKIFPGEYLQFYLPVSQGVSEALDNIQANEFTLKTRYAKDETFISGEFVRTSLGSRWPIVTLKTTIGNHNIENKNNIYGRVAMNVTDKMEINPFGFSRISVDAGYILGKVPFPLLELHKGNETYAYDYMAFNMMNYYEFASDKYISGIYEHHFQGFFLNRIPLLRRLYLREVLYSRFAWGDLSSENKNYVILPEGMGSLNKPYLEAGVGVENLLKIVRIDAIWRVTHPNPEIKENVGIRASLQLIL